MSRRGVALVLIFIQLMSVIPFAPVGMAQSPPPYPGDTTVDLYTPPIAFTDASDHITLENGISIIDFYKGTAGYNVIKDPAGAILVYNEQLVLEALRGTQWRQRGLPQSISYVKISDYEYNVTRLYDDFLGTTFILTYNIRSLQKVKWTLNMNGVSDTYRVTWTLNGITKTTSTIESDGLLFGTADDGVRFNWGDVTKAFGGIVSYAVTNVAQGRKLDVTANLGVRSDFKLDPYIEVSTIYSATAGDGIGHRNVFKNPRGTGYYYELVFTSSNLATFYKSSDRRTWSSTGVTTSAYYAYIYGLAIDIVEDSANSRLIVYVAYTYSTSSSSRVQCYTIADAASNPVSQFDASVYSAGSGETVTSTTCVVDDDGYVWVVVDISHTSNRLNKVMVSQASKPTSSSWSATATVKNYATTTGVAASNPVKAASTIDCGIFYSMYLTNYYLLFRGATRNGALAPTLGTEITVDNTIASTQYFDASEIGDRGYVVYVDSDSTIKCRYVTMSTSPPTSTAFGQPSSTYRKIPKIGIDKTSATAVVNVFYVNSTTWVDMEWMTANDGTATWTKAGKYATTYTINFLQSGRYDYAKDSEVGVMLSITVSTTQKAIFWSTKLSLQAPKWLSRSTTSPFVIMETNGWVNVTATDLDGHLDIWKVDAKCTKNGGSQTFTVTYTLAGGSTTWTATAGSSYLTLDTAHCVKTVINSTAAKWSFKFKLLVGAPTGSLDLAPTFTDFMGRTATATYSNQFTVSLSTTTIYPSTVYTGGANLFGYTSSPFNRHAFYANTRHWIFLFSYQSGGYYISYYSSSDGGNTWSSVTNIRNLASAIGGSDFSVVTDGTNVYYSLATGGNIYFRKGALNSDGTITWAAVEQTVVSSQCSMSCIDVDSTGHAWIAFGKGGSDAVLLYAVKNANTDGTWSSAVSKYFGAGDTTVYPSVVVLSNDNVYASYSNGNTMYGYLYSGTWSSAETIISGGDFAYSGTFSVAQGSNAVSVVWERGSANSYNIAYRERSSGGTWSAITTLAASGNGNYPYTSASVSVTSGGDVYVFWHEHPASQHIYYQRRISGTWDASYTDWWTESDSFPQAPNLGCFLKPYDGKIGVYWLRNHGDYPDLRYAGLLFQVNNAPTNDACGATSNFDVNAYGWVNMTVSDAQLVADLKTAQIKVTASNAKTFTLLYTRGTDTFSETADPDGICTQSGSVKVNLDSDTDKVCFRFEITSVLAQHGTCDVEATTTDQSDATDVDTYSSKFTVNYYVSITVNDGTHSWAGLSPGDTDQALGTPADGKIDLTVDSNYAYHIQAKGSGNPASGGDSFPIGNLKIHEDTLGSASALTTSYADVGGLTGLALGASQAVSFKLWASIPDPQLAGSYTYTLNIQAFESP